MKKPVSMSLVQLGGATSPEPEPESLLVLLLACHTRIRRYVRLALTVGTRPQLPAAEQLEATTQCVRYFTEALPLHVCDEEDSLWPRLAGRSPALDATMAQMRAQHFEHEAHLVALIAALEAVRRQPGSAPLHHVLASVAASLETDFEAHLRLEEHDLFPALATMLSAAEQQEIIGELRARRQPAS